MLKNNNQKQDRAQHVNAVGYLPGSTGGDDYRQNIAHVQFETSSRLAI